MILKCKKGIKINSEEGDGHKDGDKVLVFAECITPDTVKESVKSKNLENFKVPDKMYYAIFPEDSPIFFIPIATVDTKIQILSDELVDIEVEDDTFCAEMIRQLQEKIFTEIPFKFYQ